MSGKQDTFFIAGPAGRLEAVLDMPAGVSEPRAAALVLHPHPLHEGTMHNKVVYMLARSFLQLGAPALRFNFRGVGKSEGRYAEAVGETDDALAALDWLQERFPAAELWLGGFSFGAQVALRAVNQRAVQRLVTVAPPVGRFRGAPWFEPPRCAWLLIQGEEDEVVDAGEVAAWARAVQPAPDFVMVPGSGHYFHGKLNELRNAVLGRFAPGR